jgi:hypothetical protein
MGCCIDKLFDYNINTDVSKYGLKNITNVHNHKVLLYQLICTFTTYQDSYTLISLLGTKDIMLIVISYIFLNNFIFYNIKLTC